MRLSICVNFWQSAGDVWFREDVGQAGTLLIASSEKASDFMKRLTQLGNSS